MTKIKILLFLSSLASWLFAQEMPKVNVPDFSRLKDAMGKQTQKVTPTEAPVLETAIDAETYILGPGDVLSILIAGREDFNHEVMVGPEGNILLSSVGTIDVSGMTLAAVRDKVEKRIKNQYRTNDIVIKLVQLRTFLVTVSGAVQNPGIYAVPAMSRVLTAIDMSGGFITAEFESQEETKDEKTVSKYFEGPKNPESIELEGLEVQPQENRFSSRRRITVKRQSRDLLHADIEKYLRTGDLDKNPILNGGDVIFVPFREENVGSVGIYGAVRSPHEFEYVRGDKIKDMLEMAHGLATDADSSQIQLIRFTDKNTLKAFNFPLGDSSSVEYSKTVSTRLLPDDRLYVRSISNYHVKRNVTIRGQVLFPSTYPLTQTRNRLSDIIELAGGFTPEAYLESAYIIRKSSGKTNDPEYERLLTMRVMEMTELEREYFKFKARERAGLMPVDFRALFKEGNTNFDIPLADGDIIVIPAKGQSVSVFGQVVNPGLYSYVPGWTMEQYIDIAGGYNWNARRHKVRIIKSKHREWMDGEDDAPIQPGDQIFVPEKPVRNWWEIAKDVLVAATQLATIYLVIDRTRND